MLISSSIQSCIKSPVLGTRNAEMDASMPVLLKFLQVWVSHAIPFAYPHLSHPTQIQFTYVNTLIFHPDFILSWTTPGRTECSFLCDQTLPPWSLPPWPPLAVYLSQLLHIDTPQRYCEFSSRPSKWNEHHNKGSHKNVLVSQVHMFILDCSLLSVHHVKKKST